ncbi:MAG: hypothetical protein QM817_08315 [Archangium sp.]
MAHLTVARRTELFFTEVIAPLFKARGFRKTRLTFTRDGQRVRHVVQVHVAVTVSGGASPPEGYFRVWIGTDPQPSRARTEYDCAEHVELRALVPSAAASWRAPPTKGPRRQALEREFSASINALLAVLDAQR